MFSFDFDEILDFAIPISLSLFLVVKNVQFFNFLLLVLVGGKTYQVGRVYASGTTTSLHLASFNLQHNKAAHKQINHSNESFLAIILVSFWHFQFFLFQICKNDIDRRKSCFRVFFLKNFVFQCFWLNTHANSFYNPARPEAEASIEAETRKMIEWSEETATGFEPLPVDGC